MQRICKYLIFLCIVLAALAGLMVLAGDASADTHWWDGGGGDGKASTAANWYPDLPGPAGWTSVDNLTWGAVSTVNCAFDSANTAYSWNILANYTGTITQGSNDINIGAGGLTVLGGTLTPVNSHVITCAGSLYNVATVSMFLAQYVLTGTNEQIDGTWSSAKITVIGTYTLNNNLQVFGSGNTGTIVSGSLTIANGVKLQVNGNVFAGTNISGSVSGVGSGYLELSLYWGDGPINLNGNITCPVVIKNEGLSVDRTLISMTNLNVGTLSVYSEHVTSTVTLDLNGKSLSATSITAGTRGIIMSSVAGAVIHQDTELYTTGSPPGVFDMTNILYRVLPVISSSPLTECFIGGSDSFYTYQVVSNLQPVVVESNFTWIYDSDIEILSVNDAKLVRSMSLNGTMQGWYWVNVSVSNENGSAYQNYSLVVSMYVSPVEQMTVPLVFLLFCVGLSFVCYVKRVPLIVLILFLVELLGVVAMINDFGDYWYIPLGLVLVTGVMLVQSLRR